MVKDILKQENLATETLKALEKLASQHKTEKESIIKTYEERLNMVEDRSKISYDIKEQSMGDMIEVLRCEVSELTISNNTLQTENKSLKEVQREMDKEIKEIESLKRENERLKSEILNINQARENEKAVVKEQIGVIRNELYNLKQNKDTIFIKDETVTLKEQISQQDVIITELNRQLEELKIAFEEENGNTVTKITRIEEINPLFYSG